MTKSMVPPLRGVSAADPAVVVLSGGQDSVTCLALAVARHERVFAVSFRYGQKHAVELRQAAIVAEKMGVPLTVVDLSFFGDMVTSALVSDSDTTQPHAYKPGLPASFVPNRNALFLTLAHAIAQEHGATTIYTGVCQTDYSGYPDCRRVFIDALEDALNTGYQTSIQILTPMMDIDKAATFALAAELGAFDLVLEDSHTCYNGERDKRHAWGYGCGKCPACDLRKAGYLRYLEQESARV